MSISKRVADNSFVANSWFRYHLSSQKRGEIGRIEARALTNLLNGTLSSFQGAGPARRRVGELVEAFQLAAADAGVEEAKWYPKIDAKLARYPVISGLYRDDFGLLTLESRRLGRRRNNLEWIMAQCVIELAKAGLVERIRKCICGDWFFAKRENQKSCSDRCRHKLYEQTEEFKARRRKYMRKLYRLHKSGKVK